MDRGDAVTSHASRLPPRWRVLLSPPDVGTREREALLAAFDSGWIAPVGPDLVAFEEALATATGRDHAVALSSGTAALHLGLLGLGVGAGDEVWVADLTFVATANAVVHAGARPTMVDVDPSTWTIDVDLVADELARRAKKGVRPPAAIVPVDLYGRCADHAALARVAAEHGVTVLVDAAESLGARLAGAPAGSHGHAAAPSFNGNKIITTSGGGALVTDDGGLADHVRHLATQAREPVSHYEHTEVGFNHRLSNLLAALGVAQLAGLDERVARRRAINAAYAVGLGDLPGVTMMPHETEDEQAHGTLPSMWLTCLTIDPAIAGTDRDTVIAALVAEGIEARPVWKPMHMQPVHAHAPLVGTGAVSARLFDQGLALPSGSTLTDAELDEVIARVRACWH